MGYPEAVDGPAVARPTGWIGVPKLGLQQSSPGSIEAAEVLYRGGIVAGQLGVVANRGSPIRAVGQPTDGAGESHDRLGTAPCRKNEGSNGGHTVENGRMGDGCPEGRRLGRGEVL